MAGDYALKQRYVNLIAFWFLLVLICKTEFLISRQVEVYLDKGVSTWCWQPLHYDFQAIFKRNADLVTWCLQLKLFLESQVYSS